MSATHSKKFRMIKTFYMRGLWNKQMVYNVVAHNAITPEEYEEITGEPYAVLAKTNN